MRKEDTGVWTVEFRPKEIRDIIDRIKKEERAEERLAIINEIEEVLGLV